MRTLLATLLLAAAPTAFAQATFIDNATVVTTDGRNTADVVVFENGRVRIGDELTAPSGANVISGDDIWVTPGLFAPFSHVGLVDISLEGSTNDTRAGDSANSVALRAADAFNPKANAVGNSRVEGITHLATVPGTSGNIFSGTGAIVDTTGSFDSIVSEDAFIFARLGEGGADAAGGSRAAAITQLRAALRQADEADVIVDTSDLFLMTREDAEQLQRAVNGEVPLVVAANRAMDLIQLTRLKEEFENLDIIVLGAKEAWQVADRLAAVDIKVMIDPHDNLPESFESVGARLDNALLLDAAGVDYAFTTASADLSHNVRVLAQHAGNAVGEGLDWGKAFAAVSTTPREWFGIEDNSLVVWVGDPLEVTSQPLAMFIDGKQVPLTSRQIALRDRYNPATNDDRPHKYR